MVIAIDFDDTIMDTHNTLPGYRMGQPMAGCIAALTDLAAAGHTLVVFTARDVRDAKVYKAVQDWCDYFKLPISAITNIKRQEFDVYIDDRAMHFSNWEQALGELTNLQQGV